MIHLYNMTKKKLTPKQLKAILYIRNSLAHGRSPSVRDIQKELDYKSPRSAFLILESLMRQGIVNGRQNGNLQLLKDLEGSPSHERTVLVPLVGMVSCGQPILVEENTEAMIPVSKTLAHPGSKYFLLRAHGDSMTKAGIKDGDLVLVRQQPTAENGNIIVALIDDEATIKEYHRSGDAVILKPKSRNKEHKPIIVRSDFQVQGVIIATIPSLGE